MTTPDGYVEMDEVVPSVYRCALSSAIMEDPVTAMDGYNYDRANIENWFSQGKTTSPRTSALIDRHLISNESLRTAITEFRQAHRRSEPKYELRKMEVRMCCSFRVER